MPGKLSVLDGGGRGYQILEQELIVGVNLHPWRYLETSEKNFLWLAQL